MCAAYGIMSRIRDTEYQEFESKKAYRLKLCTLTIVVCSYNTGTLLRHPSSPRIVHSLQRLRFCRIHAQTLSQLRFRMPPTLLAALPPSPPLLLPAPATLLLPLLRVPVEPLRLLRRALLALLVERLVQVLLQVAPAVVLRSPLVLLGFLPLRAMLVLLLL
jgi:hypothetical protein